MATIIGRQFTRTTAFPRKGFAPDLQPGTGKSRRRQLISNIRKAKSTTHVMRGIELGSRFEKPGVNDRLEGRVSPWESCFLQQGIGRHNVRHVGRHSLSSLDALTGSS
jgi:hypothetical protein